jgi:hypothetical protein
MKEKVFNLFLFIDKAIITEIGVIINEIIGSDDDKMEFMKNAVSSGFEKSIRFLVPANFKVFVNGRTMQGVSFDTYARMRSMGAEIELFQEIFEHYYTQGIPLFWVTPIINGIIAENATGSFVANENYAVVISE